MSNRLIKDTKKIIDLIVKEASKIKDVTYSKEEEGILFAIDKTNLVLGDTVFDRIVGKNITEQLDQVLVEFPISGRNDNIIQATGSNNKKYAWSGMLFTKYPMETKEALEKLVRTNSPVPYRMFYMKKSIKVFVQSLTCNIESECIIKYNIACVEYSPPEIVSLDAQTWMDIHGDFSDVITDPNDVDGDPCLDEGKPIPLDDKKWDVTKVHIAIEKLKKALGVETSDDVSKAATRAFAFGAPENSNVYQEILDSCNLNERQIMALNGVLNLCVSKIEEVLYSNYGENFIRCIVENAQGNDYLMYIQIVDKMFLNGLIGCAYPFAVLPVFSNGVLNCQVLKDLVNSIGSFVGIVIEWAIGYKPTGIAISLKDVEFSEDCCGSEINKNTEFMQDEYDGERFKNKQEEEDNPEEPVVKPQSQCPEVSGPISEEIVSDQQNDYTCWKKDGGTDSTSGLPTYEKIDCDGDDYRKNYEHDSYFKSYDNRMGERMNPQDPYIINQSQPTKVRVSKNIKVYSPIEGFIAGIGSSYVYIVTPWLVDTKYEISIYNLEKIVVRFGEVVHVGDEIGRSGDESLLIYYSKNGERISPFTCEFLK